MKSPERALSESVSVILIVCLLIIAVIVSWGFFNGFNVMLKKSINIAESAHDVDTHLSAHGIRLFHAGGDPGLLNATGPHDATPVSFTLVSPSGTVIRALPSPLIADRVWKPGDSVYFYRDNYGYFVIDNLAKRIDQVSVLGPLVDLEGGIWTIKTIDDTVPVTINTVTVYVGGSGTGASASLYSPGLIATYYSDQGWSVPAATNIVRQVRFADTSSGQTSDVSNWPVGYIGKADHFSVKYDGFVRIDTEADYTFTLTSDDGSYLDLGGTSGFISNGGDHGPRSLSATRHLVPGYYPITVRMYENAGGAVVSLAYSTPSMASSHIVTNLWHIPSTAPTADFNGMPRAGPAPLVVQFTDLSIDAQAWSWNFGDGTPPATTKNPAHTYTVAGTYPVSLTTSNAFGSATATKPGYITVGSFSPGFLASYYQGQTWTTLAGTRIESGIHFSDQGGSTWPRDMVGRQDDISVQWDGYLFVPAEADYSFTLTSDDGSWLWVDESQLINNGGDHGSTAVTRSTRLTAGYHHLVIRMYENGGQAVADLSYSPSGSVWHIPSTAPTADFSGVPRAGPAPLVVRFTDASSDATAWSWNFGDGSPASSDQNPTHTYAAGGTYPVSLTSSNAFGTNTMTKPGYITVGTFVPGFAASYYRGQTWTDLAGTRTDSQIQFTDAGVSVWPSDMVGRKDDFSVLWDGYISVPAEADYSFRLTSDDGSWLWVDEALLIDNGGDHGSTAVTRTTRLTSGYHHVLVKMYENGGSAVAYLDYALPPSASFAPVTGVYHMP
jgi:PKD repeat protein